MTTPTRNASELADELEQLLDDSRWHKLTDHGLASFVADNRESILTALRTPTSTEEAVEAVAVAIYGADWTEPHHAAWAETAPDMRERYAGLARAAIAALSAPVSTNKVPLAFIEAILHGDEDHRMWLLEAAACWNSGAPIRPPVGKGTSPVSTVEGEACEACGGNGYSGGVMPAEDMRGEYDVACEVCCGTGDTSRERLVKKLERLHNEARGCEFDLVPSDGPIARAALFMHEYGDHIIAALRASPPPDREAVLEEAARVADLEDAPGKWDHPAANACARTIAAAIRALKPTTADQGGEAAK